MSLLRAVCGVLVCTLMFFSQSAFAISYKYDELGRLIEVTYDSGRIVSYSYDPAGNRTEHAVDFTSEFSINDNIATQGIGNNLIDLSGWPVGETPAGVSTVTGWNNNSTFYNETRWARVTGPGQSMSVTTIEAGQTEADANGGGNYTNSYLIDRTKAYEFSIYFRKYDLAVQNIYLGMTTSGGVENISNGAVNTNPYFMAWSLSTQAAYLDPNKWYKAVGYIFPEGYPLQSNSVSGGIYDVETGAKIANSISYRWNENSTSNSVYSRFFTYYSESVQNRFTTYFYQPEVRVTNISYTPVVPSLSITHINATEGQNITYNVNLSQATTVDVKVNYVVGAGSASTNDYTAVSGTLLIPEGSTQGTITVNTTADSNIEPDETIQLTLSAPVRATISEASELATILTDDFPPSFSVNNISISEGGNLTFTVTKTGATGLSHNVTYATANNTAVAGSDYTTKSGTLTFTSGQTSQTVTVATTGDSSYENNETLYLNLSGPTAGAIISDSQGVGTITNNDAAPSFSINNISIAEGGNLTFTVTKTGATVFSHSINYATANSSAVAGSDYTAKSGTLTFTSGQTSQTVTVVTTGDSSYENNETLYLNLSAATGGATIADSQGVGTITNNDSAPSFTVNNVSITEGGNLTFTVTKSGSTTLPHSINYATANSSAVASSDYTAKFGTLTFTSGQTSQTVTVVTTGDSSYENNETLYLNLNAATGGATIADSQGVGTITNNDSAPSFTVNNVSIAEGGNLTFTVTKSGSTTLPHSINYATANGTAVAGSDYTTKSGTLTFTSGQTSKTVTVVTTGDSTYESNETLYLNLSAATGGATIADSQGVGTITNNDGAPSFTVNNVSIAEGGNLTFTVTKSGATSSSHSINYATANGTAAAGSDYTTKSGTLTFTSGQTSKTVTVVTTGDSIYESNETLYLNLSAATGGATIADSQGLGTVTNNDAAPSFTVNNVSIAEGGNLTFTVTKSGSTIFSHDVTYATANNSAVAGSDYTAKSGTLTFTSSQTSQTVTVVTTGDSIYESNETLYLNLSSATSGATIADSQGVGTVNNNDTAPAFSINNVSVTEGGTLTFTVTKFGSTALSHNVTYATANGTAAAGSDYTARSGTLTFTSGQTSQTISVATTQETTYEPNETLYVNLSGATSGATISDTQGLGTINNDDPLPNNPPVANNDSASTTTYTSKTIYVLANDTDADGDTLTVTSVSSSLCWIVASNRIVCEFFAGGTKTTSYSISDGKGGTDSATVTINVTNGGGGGGPFN